MEELELVQRKLLKVLIEETEETEEQGKSLINQLSKTIAENSKVLAEFGMGPPVLSRIKSLISVNYNAESNDVDEEIRQLTIQHKNVKSGIYLPMDNEDDHQNEFLE